MIPFTVLHNLEMCIQTNLKTTHSPDVRVGRAVCTASISKQFSMTTSAHEGERKKRIHKKHGNRPFSDYVPAKDYVSWRLQEVIRKTQKLGQRIWKVLFPRASLRRWHMCQGRTEEQLSSLNSCLSLDKTHSSVMHFL